jgi:hypothetical protein
MMMMMIDSSHTDSVADVDDIAEVTVDEIYCFNLIVMMLIAMMMMMMM